MNDQPITEAELAEWEKVYAEATEGPWSIHTPAEEYLEVRGPSGHVSGQSTERLFGDIDVRPNAKLIAAQREFGPRLIAEVRRLQKRLELAEYHMNREDFVHYREDVEVFVDES